MIFKRFLQFLGLLALIGVFLPLLPIEFWFVRMFDYPHIELTIFTLIALLLYLLVFNRRSKRDYFFLGFLLFGFINQVVIILPYTPLAPKEVKTASSNAKEVIEIFQANVLQKNKKHIPLIKKLKAAEPDIILLTETDSSWAKDIHKAIAGDYPYRVENPQDNTYGMLVFSKFELLESKTVFSVRGKIPSVYCTVKTPDGQQFKLYCIHPTPPKPEHKSTDSDREKLIKKIGLRAQQKELPVVVLGDFNEVAWSEHVQLFKQICGLNDVRVGRGFYNTFNAKSALMSWPLDQIFVSSEFHLKNLKVCNSIHSDHYPLQATLTFEP